MDGVAGALYAALRSMLHPRMFLLVIWPVAGALLLWGLLAWLFWGDWVYAVGAFITGTPVDSWLREQELLWVAGYVASFLVILLVSPLVLVTALLIAAVVAMPVMVRHVAVRDFAALEARRGGTFAGSIWNMLVAIVTYLLLWLVTLPLWLFGPLAAPLPLLLGAYLNQRLFRYDALAEHAGREEFAQVIERAGGRLYVLGAILALVQFIPVLNLFSPIYVGLVFIHFCLRELAALRAGT